LVHTTRFADTPRTMVYGYVLPVYATFDYHFLTATVQLVAWFCCATHTLPAHTPDPGIVVVVGYLIWLLLRFGWLTTHIVPIWLVVGLLLLQLYIHVLHFVYILVVHLVMSTAVGLVYVTPHVYLTFTVLVVTLRYGWLRVTPHGWVRALAACFPNTRLRLVAVTLRR